MNKIYVRLAKTNMRNNRQLYVPYILSGLITVAMFYLMTFLSGNEGLAHARGAEMIGRILSFGVDIIGIFSYIFIFYTNSFISKRRKKRNRYLQYFRYGKKAYWQGACDRDTVYFGFGNWWRNYWRNYFLKTDADVFISDSGYYNNCKL